MNMRSLREIAKARGVSPGKLGKTELVRTFQHEEGTRLFCQGVRWRLRSARLFVAGRLSLSVDATL